MPSTTTGGGPKPGKCLPATPRRSNTSLESETRPRSKPYPPLDKVKPSTTTGGGQKAWPMHASIAEGPGNEIPAFTTPTRSQRSRTPTGTAPEVQHKLGVRNKTEVHAVPCLWTRSSLQPRLKATIAAEVQHKLKSASEVQQNKLKSKPRPRYLPNTPYLTSTPCCLWTPSLANARQHTHAHRSTRNGGIKSNAASSTRLETLDT